MNNDHSILLTASQAGCRAVVTARAHDGGRALRYQGAGIALARTEAANARARGAQLVRVFERDGDDWREVAGETQ